MTVATIALGCDSPANKYMQHDVLLHVYVCVCVCVCVYASRRVTVCVSTVLVSSLARQELLSVQFGAAEGWHMNNNNNNIGKSNNNNIFNIKRENNKNKQ